MHTTENDTGALIQRAIETWTKEIAKYVQENKDNMTARNILAQRTIGANVEIDVVTNYDRTGPGAQIVAKGAIPDKSGTKTSFDKHNMFQIATGFNINAKDLKLDPKLKNRMIDICMRDIHRKEDEFALFGDTRVGVNGLVDAAEANDNGKIVASGASGSDTNNAGSWFGETGTDIYDDLNTAIGKMDGEFQPAYLVGSRKSLQTLNRMSSERIPYYKEVSGLFGMKNEADKSWMWETAQLGDTKVYVIPKDFMAGEYVVSENPRLVPYALAPGENYPFEVISWSSPEIHSNEGFVEIEIT